MLVTLVEWRAPGVPGALHREAHALGPALAIRVRHAWSGQVGSVQVRVGSGRWVSLTGVPVAVEDHHADVLHQQRVGLGRKILAGALPHRHTDRQT